MQIHTLNPHRWAHNYADYLYAFAISRINDEEQSRDLVQETFLAALEKLDRFEGKSHERTWLTAILKNKIIDVYRKRASGLNKSQVTIAEQEQGDFFEEPTGHWNELHQPQSFGLDQYNPLFAKEFNQILRQCMDKLPALWFSVFKMKHMDDSSSETICTELGLSSANFWVIIHRAKLNLRACLQKNWA